MRLWNKANRDADGETKLIFATEETKLASGRPKQYTLDFATMLGTARGAGNSPVDGETVWARR